MNEERKASPEGSEWAPEDWKDDDGDCDGGGGGDGKEKRRRVGMEEVENDVDGSIPCHTVVVSSAASAASAVVVASVAQCSYRRMESIAPPSESSCSVCFEDFMNESPGDGEMDRRPHLLKCSNKHHVCATCAAQLSQRESSTCPVCRLPFSASELHTGLIMKLKLAEMMGIQGNESDADNKEQQEVEMITIEKQCKKKCTTYCHQCKLDYCDEHAQTEHANEDKRVHELIPIAEKDTFIKKKLMEAGMCIMHPTLKLDMYCAQCKVVCCGICCLNNHALKLHQPIDLVDVAAEKMKQQLMEKFQNLRQVACVLDSAQADLKQSLDAASGARSLVCRLAITLNILSSQISAVNAAFPAVDKVLEFSDGAREAAHASIRAVANEYAAAIFGNTAHARHPPHVLLVGMNTTKAQWEKVIHDAAMRKAQCSQLAQSPSPFGPLGLTKEHVIHVNQLADQLLMHL